MIMKQQTQTSVTYTIENYDLFLLLSEFLQNLLSKQGHNNTIYTYYNDSEDRSIKIVSNRELIGLEDAVLEFLKNEKVTTEVKIDTINSALWKN